MTPPVEKDGCWYCPHCYNPESNQWPLEDKGDKIKCITCDYVWYI